MPRWGRSLRSANPLVAVRLCRGELGLVDRSRGRGSLHSCV